MQASDISADQTALFINTLADFGTLIDRSKESLQSGLAHFHLCFFIIERSNSFADLPADFEGIVFHTVRQLVAFGIISIDNITYTLCADPCGSGKQGLYRCRLFFISEGLFFHWLKFSQEAYQNTAGMCRQLNLHHFVCLVIGYFYSRKAHGFHIELNREYSLFMAGGYCFYLTGQIVVTQDIAEQMALLVFAHCSCLMCFGCIAVFTYIQVCYHGIVRVGYGCGMPPGVFRIQQGVIAVSFYQLCVMNTGLFFQSVADTV